MSRINATLSHTNGTVPTTTRKPATPRKSKPKGGVKVTARQLNRARWWLTTAMGCGIPAMTLSLSCIGGYLSGKHDTVGGTVFLALTCCALVVSLQHVAEAIQDITHCTRFPAWIMAIIVDCAMVSCEIWAEDFWLATAVKVGLTAASMCLNCWAFHSHKTGK